MRTGTSPSIAFDDVGDREPALLCMPGWCGPRDVFRPLHPHVGRRLLAVDWRGHGGSEAATDDFGVREFVADAYAVLDRAGVSKVIPVAIAHAGWVAIELRKRLGAARVPGIVLLDWMVLGAPPPFAEALQALQQPATTEVVRDKLFGMWGHGAPAEVHTYVQKMAKAPIEMWRRGGREIEAAFRAVPVPLDEIHGLGCPTLHLYAQPADQAFFDKQQAYAATHPWFRVQRLEATSHFPTFEVPREIATAIDAFAAQVA